MKETALHAELKAWYAQAGGLVEREFEGYIVDVVRADEFVEIQTQSFSALRVKLEHLLRTHVVRVVYPVAVERWIVRIDTTGRRISRRKSPKKGSVIEVFNELTSLHGAIAHPNFRLEVVLIKEEQVWRDDGRGSWRRKHWSLADRRLLAVTARETFLQPGDYDRLLPEALPAEFTTRDMKQALNLKTRPANAGRLVGRMALALRQMGTIQQVGKRGSAFLYVRNE